MKRTVLLAGCVVLLVSSAAYAAKQAVSAAKITLPAVDLAAEEKTKLEGTEWAVEMKQAGTKAKAETDTIIFSEGKVVSKNLQELGYAPSNFSVRIDEDGTVIWETMQSSEQDGTAFWRGDIKDGIMRGVLSKKDKKERVSDFNFVSTTKK